ncbi:hypothetical protein PBT90_00635 [Algoriphagus halophytocola]|uniref:Lipocalin-like domain-containing protein n=1 Tax=Algoriphagus halophytocola TaxID=2991499 RepID=A0ABY6MED3_9BACT|nr:MULTISPECIES: hypothetical protein [unclassified Algoriphagus]UZD21963.1 hypothetical protein OM944_14960 [Algoriphagus sp. TR-M5]WBL43214.1 hypothetical protein PBT90_00635 [Algoriphagus sp. TR-M9]
MRFSLLTITLFMIIPMAMGQRIAGHWSWVDAPGDRSFEIELWKNVANPDSPNSYDFVGTHCGVYYNGGRMDCAEEISIRLKSKEENILTGIIKSAYSESVSKIKLTVLADKNRIKWEVTGAEGQFYFPYDAVLEK